MNSTHHPSPPAFSPREFRDALGMFATGVTIVTTRGAGGELVGMTVNSFNSVSLDPPLVLWSLAHKASSLQAFASATHYAINVLAVEQRALAERFATRGIDRWAGVAHHPGLHDMPVIEGAAAVFECTNRSQYAEGDHTIFVGRVERCTHLRGASPLLYHGGMFYTEHALGQLADTVIGP
ncbi:flavin reductase family protein [Alicycliphilus denitrificans]|uniref:Flavin reductase n=1 Tax=Alicycliphilus denitrificans TaxID=179636 RepID=A0A3R7LHB6_9BURK|nr:flavin reductase family protein [Alicycliphilus denitrificans]MBN9573198.1 flavin reductase family protein [Alicycliphilus denitrificans]OJW90789.1 MAG: flavin reductase [Alicycliphilus sp. 69-12]RKJ99318.1 flavin reductase [Alicycliphilus denitrificans]